MVTMANPKGGKMQKLDDSTSVIVQLVSAEGEKMGTQLQLPHGTTAQQLGVLLNGLLGNEEPLPFAFYIAGLELGGEVGAMMLQHNLSVEAVVEIVYQPQAVFRVRAVGRCTASMAGHKEAVLCVHFSPDGRQLATGSGDSTVRFWDLGSQLPLRDGQAHRSWVMAVAWSPDAQHVASGDKNGVVHIWDPRTGASRGACTGHKKWITSIAWEPAHRRLPAARFATASKDNTVRVWSCGARQQELCMAGHSNTINCVKWAGDGTILSASNDREIRVWNGDDGRLIRLLGGHAHWINSLALSSEHALRTGAFDHAGRAPADPAEAREVARQRFEECTRGQPERLVSGSDDYTMFLWVPSQDKKPRARLTGHQQLINHVQFSPDGRWLLSASFDKSVKLWDGATGKFIASFRGHVGPVYQVSWSADSRLFVSASKDSTLKVWELRTRKLKEELPGHADEVFAVDWSPEGSTVASGGKDKVVKLWRH